MKKIHGVLYKVMSYLEHYFESQGIFKPIMDNSRRVAFHHSHLPEAYITLNIMAD